MRIYPINQSPIMFRGSNVQQHSTLRRYCEPRTGAYYYYDTVEFENEKKQNNIFEKLKNKLSSMSSAIRKTFTQNYDSDDISWL